MLEDTLAPAAIASIPVLSVVIPVYNESLNLPPLLNEIVAVLSGWIPYEIICANDGSSDSTAQVLQECKATIPLLIGIHHLHRTGQSTEVLTDRIHKG